MRSVRARLRRAFHELRTEGAGAAREAAAIGVGIFIGCLPVYGFHLMLCWATGWMLRLNRLKMYLAANISNPLVAPTLVFAEIQIGAWLRRGSWHALSIDTVRTADLGMFSVDALVGSVFVGSALGLSMFLTTYFMSRGTPDDDAFLPLVRESSDRYITASMTAWEFARGKLRGDPVYRAIVSQPLLPASGTVVDIGCGQGLTLALLADAERLYHAGSWPARWSPPPQFNRKIGIELRPRAASIARKALDAAAEILEGDVRTLPPIPCDAALYLDVFHMIPYAEQEELVAATAAALKPGGVMLVRDADAAAGWRFDAVRFGNRLKAIVFGAWRQRFYFRTADEWLACFARHGLHAELRPMTSGAFANVLFRLTRSDA